MYYFNKSSIIEDSGSSVVSEHKSFSEGPSIICQVFNLNSFSKNQRGFEILRCFYRMLKRKKCQSQFIKICCRKSSKLEAFLCKRASFLKKRMGPSKTFFEKFSWKRSSDPAGFSITRGGGRRGGGLLIVCRLHQLF